jgi:hypothetical protein
MLSLGHCVNLTRREMPTLHRTAQRVLRPPHPGATVALSKTLQLDAGVWTWDEHILKILKLQDWFDISEQL